MHYDLIIISDHEIKNKLLDKFNYTILNNSHYLLDLYHLDNHYSFDYLIFTSLNTIKDVEILTENHIVITNCYFQTNYEHIFALGKINNSILPISDQLQIILEYLIN